jgi:glycosyltransferase involved in cell wall biosynthesis
MPVQRPLVSIITPSYNQAQYIQETILSVRNQDYPFIEHLVVDGGSTDETLDILRQYEDRLTWISEPDRGQADAINKGLRRARGDILAWLNSDDAYMPGAIQTVVDYFEAHPEAHFIYGDALAIDEHGRAYGIRAHVKQGGLDELVNELDFIVQPASFWRAGVWRACGELDESLHYNLDYEYWMRVARRYPLRYAPVVLARERLYAQAKSFRGAVERLEELEAVARRHGGDGLPRGYHALAAASYLLRAGQQVWKGRWSSARRDLRKAAALRPRPLKFLQFVAVMLLFGPAAVPRFWLWLNRLRRWRKRDVRVR